jgi:hypothetical protein
MDIQRFIRTIDDLPPEMMAEIAIAIASVVELDLGDS